MSSERFGGTWWGRRWVEDLERLSTAWQNRLPRGRDYAAKGHVLSLQVSKGKITARVQGSRSKPYTTSIEVVANREPDWERLIRRLASRARYPAQLLAGEMPRDIEDAFRDAGLSLFPTRNSELMGRCSCPDKGRPCKHIAAVHYAFGEALDRDPFLLFQLRGADRATLLREFQRVWFGQGAASTAPREADEESEAAQGERITPMSADRFNRSPAPVENMAFGATPPESALLVLRRLDQPRPWSLPVDVKDLFGPVYEEASALAQQLALSTENGREEEEEEGDDIDADAFADLAERLAEDEDDDTEDDDDEEGDGDADGARPPREAPAATPADAFVALSGQASTKEPRPAPTVSESTSTSAPRIRRAQGGDSLKRMLGDALPSAPERKAPEPRSLPTPQEAEPAVLIRRGSGDSIRNRGKRDRKSQRAMSRAVAIDVSGPQRDSGIAQKHEKDALHAWAEENAEAAIECATSAWQIEPSLTRLLLLLAASDTLNRRPQLLDSQAERLTRHGEMLAGLLEPAQLLLLLLAGRWSRVAETLRQRVAQGVSSEDAVAMHFLAAGLLAVAGHAHVAPGSALAAHWAPLFETSDPALAELAEAPAPVGAWLEWALDETPPDDDALAAIEDALCDVALALLAHREARTGSEPARTACRAAVAVAEALTLRESHQRFSVFLHRGNTLTADSGPLQMIMHECLVSSPILPSSLAAPVGEAG